MFLDGTSDAAVSGRYPESAALLLVWAEHGPAIDANSDLRTWLRLKFFPDVHRQMYENRPIHWPLSSGKRTFVAWVNIHRFTDRTLRVLLADHLHPAQARLDGELNDLRAARDGADKKASAAADKRLQKVKKWREELAQFIADVTQCAERGAPPTHPDPKKCPPREVDAPYTMDLDDGVMINAAGLWPLLAPQWKDPKKWWTELCLAKGRKDYDWAHLSMRYFPTRVDEKCQQDPSLGVAHGCFWAYHPARAWAWELRLQEEIGPNFRIEEPDYRGTGDDKAHRTAWIKNHPQDALDAVEKEAVRRMGRGDKKKVVPSLTLLDAGLWTTLPAACWDLEDRLTDKQDSPFHLLSPDEPEARASYVVEHPAKAQERDSRQPDGQVQGDLL